MTEKSNIRCDIDFDLQGKQSGFLGVPISTNESAYGTITIPITVLNHGSGPTMSFTGGIHGDEYEGPVTLMKLARALQPDEINGRVIIIPSLNLPAVLAGDRCSPIDGLNLNRVFPGVAGGSITESIAHFITSILVPLTDAHVDLHSGGKTLEYLPMMFSEWGEDDTEINGSELALVFGADITLVSDIHPDSGRFLGSVFDEAGVVNFAPELGGAGVVNPYIVGLAEHGIRNMMRDFGIMDGEIVTPEMQGREPTRMARVEDGECYVMAPDDGLHEPYVDLGDEIEEGQVIGQVHYPQHHDVAPWEIVSPRAGFLLCKRPPGRVQRGDNIAIIAQDAN